MRRRAHPRLRIALAALGAALTLLAATSAATAKETSLTAGPVTATLTSSGNLRSPGPVSLTMTRDDVATAFTGLQNDTSQERLFTVFPSRPLILRDLDGDREPEAIVRLFSGGAHCCERTLVASLDPATGAYRLATKDFGDASWMLRDVAGAGVPSFVSWDFRWAYWGGVYAGSPQPIQIWSFANGAFTDTTRNFPAAIRTDQKRQLAYSARARREGGNFRGALAAYVADGYSLGAPGPALARVRAAYQGPGHERFFRALRNQLKRLGYLAPIRSTPPPAGTAGGY